MADIKAPVLPWDEPDVKIITSIFDGRVTEVKPLNIMERSSEVIEYDR